MAFTREMAINFWFEFDNSFASNRTPEIENAIAQIGGSDFFRMRWRFHRDNGSYPDGFKQEALARSPGLLTLSQAQLAIIDKHFAGDEELVRRSFEDFGQGVLFDDRRRVGDKIHKMDVGPGTVPPIGYHRWHAIIRAAVFAGADENRWVQINRYVGLAWAIQSETKPPEDNPNNPGIKPERLVALDTRWLAMDVAGLETQFDNLPYPLLNFEDDIRPMFRPFDISSMQQRVKLSDYNDVKAKIQKILLHVRDLQDMPCDAPWSADYINRMENWVSQGMAQSAIHI